MAGTGSSKVVDPIAYRAEEQQSVDTPVTEESTNWNFDPSKLQNADVNLSAYGDDSSETNYNNQDLWGGENSKYTGAETKNTSVAYDKNASLENLNPNYAYGQKAQMVNSSDAGYIQRRNDQIASALYNAGKTSIQDVADYLNQQQGFMDSNENERNNTIASVWKRLGEMGKDSSNGNENENNEGNGQPVEDNSAVENMESDLLSDTSGKIYGKVTADKNGADSSIKTLSDAYNVEQAVNRQRINNFKALQSIDSISIAASIVSGTIPYGEQGMRDLMQYDPQKYKEVQEAVKEMRTQKIINSLSSDGTVDYTDQTSSVSEAIDNEITSFAFDSASSAEEVGEIINSVKTSLSSNQTANTASETMDNIESDIATLQKRLKNLDKEAAAVFKGDVPQYIVNAYKSNKQQEIQDQIETLTSRYNMAANRYQNEWNNLKWQAEYNLKLQQLKNQEEQQTMSNYFNQQKIDQQRYELYNKYGNSKGNGDGNDVPTTTLTNNEIDSIVDNLVEQCESGQLTKAQCAAGIQTNYLPFLGVDLGSLSAYSKKQGICNETDLANYTPKKGDLVVMSSPTKPENGHIGIVVGVDESTGTLKYLDWNGSVKDGVGTEEAEVRTTQLSNSKIYGYYNPTKTSVTDTDNGDGYYNPNFADIYSKFLQGQMYSEGRLDTAIKSVGVSDIDELRSQAEAWKNAQRNSDEVVNRLNTIGQLLSSSLSRYERQAATANNWVGSLNQLVSGDYGDFATQYQFIKDNITFDKLLDLKQNGATFGALSDNELRAIGAAASRLKTSMSNEEFEKELVYIYNTLMKGIGEEGNMTKEAIIESVNNGNMFSDDLPEENF